MNSYLVLCQGPISQWNPDPLCVPTLDQALAIVEETISPHLSVEDDRIQIYELPMAMSGRATIVWHFEGLYFTDPNNTGLSINERERLRERLADQGFLPGHDESLYDELLHAYCIEFEEDDFGEREIPLLTSAEANRLLDNIIDNEESEEPRIIVDGVSHQVTTLDQDHGRLQ